MNFADTAVRTREAVAVGAGFDEGRRDRLIEVLGEAADVLRAEGVRAGLHNHVGTWVGYDEASERGLFREPGTGGIDLDAVLAALPDGFPGWIVIEIDRTVMDPFESARACQAWVERVTSRGVLRPPRR